MKKTPADEFQEKVVKKMLEYYSFFTLLVFMEECQISAADVADFIINRRDKKDE